VSNLSCARAGEGMIVSRAALRAVAALLKVEKNLSKWGMKFLHGREGLMDQLFDRQPKAIASAKFDCSYSVLGWDLIQ
jgi:hypothetical protein